MLRKVWFAGALALVSAAMFPSSALADSVPLCVVVGGDSICSNDVTDDQRGQNDVRMPEQEMIDGVIERNMGGSLAQACEDVLRNWPGGVTADYMLFGDAANGRIAPMVIISDRYSNFFDAFVTADEKERAQKTFIYFGGFEGVAKAIGTKAENPFDDGTKSHEGAIYAK